MIELHDGRITYLQLFLSDYFAKVSEALDIARDRCRMEVQNATSYLYDLWGQPEKYTQLQKMFRFLFK